MPNGPVSIHLVVLRARELDRAEEFYQSLGMTFVRHAHGAGPVHLSCELGTQVFELYPLTDDRPSTAGVRIGFSVASVDEVFAAIVAAGGKAISEPADSPWGRRAVVDDLDGHRIELTESSSG